MKKKSINHLFLLFFALALFSQLLLSQRSIHRPLDPHLPYITTCWDNDPDGETHTLRSPYLAEWALFGRFKKDFLLDYQLPAHVPYRSDPTKSIPRETLEQLITNFIKELLTRNKKGYEFKDFTVLKDRDFDYKTSAGLIIIKFKDYPFVVKLFRETPKTFTRPFSKGIEPCFFFVMGNGINRYLAGFTRIPNLHVINKKIASDPYWSDRLTTPKKWFWIPQDVRWFRVTGTNIGTKNSQSMAFPSIYGIICEAIEIEREFSLSNSQDRKIGMKLARFVGNRIDPHIDNFSIEKGTGKIAFIDTEHFASIVGLNEPLYFNHYASWYSRLAHKCLVDSMFQTKRKRRDIQKQTTPEILIL